MREQKHKVDFCVVGGGMAGLCAALAAARHGAKVALVQDRPVLGGNASSEIRMWICGAHGENNRETGILEEIQLANLHRNPRQNYSLWDSVLYEKARFQENLELFLNCTVTAAAGDGARLRSVKGWQLTTESWHLIEADLFADCSGDGTLGALAGAEFRLGREARREFGEDIAPEEADRKTMGMSCLLQLREAPGPRPFRKPAWAHTYRTDEEMNAKPHGHIGDNYWWIEVGGEQDSIHDTEQCRDELLKIVFGVWDHLKNQGDHGMANWELEWVGFLPGKRESRRFVGDHILTQHDVRAEGRFDDLVAYGGWSMDDHYPAGFHHPGHGTIFHPAPSPYGIPYRCLYSRNLGNLFFAGRNISATHAAISSTRVMGTCSLLGQAVGTAAAIAVRHGLTPRAVGQQRLRELQQTLMEDDCWLPGRTREVPELARTAALTASEGDPEPLRNGCDRPVAGADNGWSGRLGATVTYEFAAPRQLRLARLVFDSDLNRQPYHGTRCIYPLNQPEVTSPASLVRAFRLEIRDAAGAWRSVHHEPENHQRLVRIPLSGTATAVRFVPEATWGAELAHLFAFDVR